MIQSFMIGALLIAAGIGLMVALASATTGKEEDDPSSIAVGTVVGGGCLFELMKIGVLLVVLSFIVHCVARIGDSV